MVLSRIWSAFIIIAILVAGVRMLNGDEKIFNRMVVGKSSEKYDSVYYYGIGSPANQQLAGNYTQFLKEYGYHKTDSLQQASVLLTDNLQTDSVTTLKAAKGSLAVFTYVSVQKQL